MSACASAGADRDADVGLRQRRRVIHTVADHRDPLALRLQRFDVTGLVGRKHLGKEPLDAERTGNGGSRARIVAGDHHGFNAQLLEAPDGLLSRRLDGIRDRDQPGRLPINGNEHRRLALLGQCRRLRFQWRRVHSLVAHQLAVADEERAPVHHGTDAVAGDRLKLRCVGQAGSPLPRAGHDRLGQGVFGPLLSRRHQPQQILFRHGIYRHHIGQRGLAFRERAGLVEHDRADTRDILQRGGILDQNEVERADPPLARNELKSPIGARSHVGGWMRPFSWMSAARIVIVAGLNTVRLFRPVTIRARSISSMSKVVVTALLPLATPAPQALLAQRYPIATGNKDVVEQLQVEQARALVDLGRHHYVLGRGLDRARGVVVADNDAGRVQPEGRLKDLADADQRRVQRAAIDAVKANHAVAAVQLRWQSRRGGRLPRCARYSPHYGSNRS